MKQHFRNKFYILSAKHYNKQFGSKCEKFISVYRSLIMTFGHKKASIALAAMGPKHIWHTEYSNYKIGTIWILAIIPKNRLKAF